VRRILLDPKSNRGGDSDLPNQALVCYHHHRLLHEGGWKMTIGPNGEIVVFRPPPTFGNWARGPDIEIAV